ncbi:MAG TPA: NBR1-Ig-like domain-containing protein [Anaerolineales bacterium]|nr:NBR1-Ig-like domain-containing protein [Anaerolineales bacterium]
MPTTTTTQDQIASETPGTATPTSGFTPTTNPPLQTSTPNRLCDQAAPGNPIDVTIPDDTSMLPNQVFTKIWRLQNIGTCAWTKSYSVTFFSGEQMGAPASVPIPGEVAPGQSIDISVDMIAPGTAGKYQGNWKLRNAANVLFGIGPSSSAPFWVRIVVVQTSTPTLTPQTPTPSPTATSTPVVLVSGTITLTLGANINLDTNHVNDGGEDLSYTNNAEGQHLLLPLGSTMAGYFGQNQPSFTNCQQASLSALSIVIESTPIGGYLCYKTGQGLPGRARLINLNTETSILTLDVLTWMVP